MRALLIPAVLVALPASAGDLDTFLKSLTVQARADQNGFAARVAAQFQVGHAQVQAVISNVKEPADAFMIFQMSQLSGLPHDRVMHVYRSHHHKGGWGAMAKELGIKPGSPEFHRLKRGDFRLEDEHRRRDDDDRDHGRKHDKGHGKGHKKDRD